MLLPAKAAPEASFELSTIWEHKTVQEDSLFPCLPAIGEDGSVYLGSPEGILYAFGPDGSLKWKNTKHSIRSDIVIDRSGTIYAASDGLRAFATDGTLKWQVKPGPDYNGGTSSPALGANGQIYFRHGRKLCAVTRDGKIEWEREVHDQRWRFPPVVSRDGILYTGGFKESMAPPGNLLYAFGLDGSAKWTFETRYFRVPPALDDEGTIYFVGYHSLLAVDAAGRLKWAFDTGTEIFPSFSTPAVSSDHVIYLGVDTALFAIGGDGKLKWKFETHGKVASSPALDANGNVWFGSNDGHLYCVDQKGGLVGAWPFEGLKCATPLIGKDGTIYLRDIHSLRVLRGTTGPNAGPWPMKRHDAQGTGRVPSR